MVVWGGGWRVTCGVVVVDAVIVGFEGWICPSFLFLHILEIADVVMSNVPESREGAELIDDDDEPDEW